MFIQAVADRPGKCFMLTGACMFADADVVD